jgi:hypothetical protein
VARGRRSFGSSEQRSGQPDIFRKYLPDNSRRNSASIVIREPDDPVVVGFEHP